MLPVGFGERQKQGLMQVDLIFDVGMHRGEDTALYLAKGFRVVAFEANPELVEHCRRRFAKETAEGRLTIIAGAIVNPTVQNQKVAFYVNKRLSVWNTAVHSWAERYERLGAESTQIEVDPVDIAEVFRTYGTPHYIKIDIEGADGKVLDAIRVLPLKPQYLSIESERVSFANLKAELERLSQLGYAHFKHVQQATIPGRTVMVETRTGERIPYTFEVHSSGSFGAEAPGRWMTMNECLRAYSRIFVLYRVFGDNSILRRSRAGCCILNLVHWIIRRPLPGWYDTHVRL